MKTELSRKSFLVLASINLIHIIAQKVDSDRSENTSFRARAFLSITLKLLAVPL